MNADAGAAQPARVVTARGSPFSFCLPTAVQKYFPGIVTPLLALSSAVKASCYWTGSCRELPWPAPTAARPLSPVPCPSWPFSPPAAADLRCNTQGDPVGAPPHSTSTGQPNVVKQCASVGRQTGSGCGRAPAPTRRLEAHSTSTSAVSALCHACVAVPGASGMLRQWRRIPPFLNGPMGQESTQIHSQIHDAAQLPGRREIVVGPLPQPQPSVCRRHDISLALSEPDTTVLELY